MGQSKLLINESPILFQPSLAAVLGDANLAIIIQQVHYWSERSSKEIDGHKWVYNSIADWHKQFPWLSVDTVKRGFNKLEEKGLLISGNYNKLKFDRTKWYAIDYGKLNQCISENDTIESADTQNALGQNAPMEEGNMPKSQQGNLHQPIPIDYQETTQEITSPPTPSQGSESDEQLIDPFLAEKMLDGFNKATGRQVKNKGTFSKLVMNGVKYQEFSDVLHWVFDTWSDPSMLTSSGLVKKFDQYSDTANELGFLNGQRPKKKPKVQPNSFGRRQVQEPEMVTGNNNQQSSDDFQAALADLKGIKTKGQEETI